MAARIYQWMFRSAAIGDLRERVAARGARRTAALRQAQFELEVARRVAQPVDALPPGAADPVLLTLYRDAVHWALVAALPEESALAEVSLDKLWGSYVPDRFPSAPSDPDALEKVRALLVEAPTVMPLETPAGSVALARQFAEGLVRDLEAPKREIDRFLAQRWSRVVIVGAVMVALGMGVRTLALGPNLAEGKPVRTSSSWSGCVGDPMCSGILFHTNDENNPWAEIDLGAPKSIHRIEVTNRDDCCAERAIPLIVETSLDGRTWSEVGRRDKDFSTWTIKLSPRSARYVKLRVPRQTVFHLKQVAVR